MREAMEAIVETALCSILYAKLSYTLATYPMSTIESMNWDQIETQLLQISAEYDRSTGNAQSDEEIIRRISNDLLRRFSADINHK
jgi:hypothetical protein